MSKSNTKVLRNGSAVYFQEIEEVAERLPVGYYYLAFDQRRGCYFLSLRNKFTLPKKTYGNPEEFAARIITAYQSRGKGMAVLFSGEKGMGKTMSAKMVANTLDQPVIIIAADFHGPELTEFIETINVPCVFFIDEFEKVFHSKESRNYWLSMLDGVGTSKHLFLLTSNDSNIGPQFNSRPNRVWYHKKYDCLDDAILHDMVRDNISDPKLQEETLNYLLGIVGLNADAVMSVCHEVEMFQETPSKFMDFFNVASDADVHYDVEVKLHRWSYDANDVNEELMRRFELPSDGNPNDPKNIKLVYNTAYRETRDTWQAVLNNWVEHLNDSECTDISQIPAQDVDEASEHLLKFLKFKEQKLSGKYMSCFEYDDAGRLSVDADYLYHVGEKDHWGNRRHINISWEHDDIKTIKKLGRKIEVTNKNGSVLIAKPIQKRRLSGAASDL